MHIQPLALTHSTAYRALRLRLRALQDHPDAFPSSFEEEAQRPLADITQRMTAPAESLWGAFDGPQLVGMVGMSRETRVKNQARAGFVSFGVEPDTIRVQGVRLGKRHMALQLPTPTESLHDA